MGAAKIPLSAEEFDNPILHCGSQGSLADPAGRPNGGDLDRAQVARTRAGRHWLADFSAIAGLFLASRGPVFL